MNTAHVSLEDIFLELTAQKTPEDEGYETLTEGESASRKEDKNESDI